MRIAVLFTFTLLPLSLAKDVPVAVGKDGVVFTPHNVTAAKGDNVIFTFYPQNHSVAQSSFEKPCAPIDNAIFSGFHPVTTGKGDTFNITIQDDNPIWLYCSYGGHCQAGMAMGINAPGNTVEKYIQNSGKAAANISPDKVSNGTTTGGGSSSSSSSSSSASASGTATSTPSSSGTSSGTSTSSSATGTNAAVNLNAGVGMGAMGLLGALVAGMI